MSEMKRRSRILEDVHEMARGMRRVGAIDDNEMRRFDALCREPVPTYDSERIRELRSRVGLSQADLASVLNTSLSTVQKWEVGAKKPGGPSSMLLFLLDRKGLDGLMP